MEEYEFVVFEDKVGIVVKTSEANLSQKINEVQEILRTLNKSKSIPQNQDSIIRIEQTNVNELAQRMNIDKNKLMKLFEIESKTNNFHLIGNVVGDQTKERVLNAALMVLTLNEYLFGKGMSCIELGNIIKNAGLPTDNLAKILKEERRLIIATGEHRSIDYRLTRPGKKEGLNIIFKHVGLDDKQETEPISEVH